MSTLTAHPAGLRQSRGIESLPDDTTDKEDDIKADRVLLHVRQALRGLRFGTITIVVQDGVTMQIERTEKRRLHRPAPPANRETHG